MKSYSHIGIAVIGHIDSGKSTTAGHLLYKCGSYDKRTVEKMQYIARDLAKQSLSFAFLLDKTAAERERGVTIDISMNSFKSEKYQFSIVDTPGHRDYIKNMIGGTSQADVALLIIAAPSGEFETGISSNGQTREHILLAYTLGLKQMIVCVNKMDEKTVDWSEQRFNEIKKETSDYLKKAGYNPDKIPFVPISGWTGDNLIEKCPSKRSSWYEGPTLLEALDSLTPPKRPIDKPLRIPVHDRFYIGDIGEVAVGRVETGLFQSQKLRFPIAGLDLGVGTIETHHEKLFEAAPGQIVGFQLKGGGARCVRRGDVGGCKETDPPEVCEEFTAQVIVLNHPTKIKAGYMPVIHCHVAHATCRFEEILSKLDRKTSSPQEEDPQSLKNGESGLVRLTPFNNKPLIVESFSDYPPLGRFVVRDMTRTVAVGIVKSVKKKTNKKYY